MEAYIRKKQYNAKTIIQDIELDIEDGTFACVLAPSGVGKTTLMNCLLGMIILNWTIGVMNFIIIP